MEQKRLPWAKKVVYFLAFVFSLIYLSWRGLYTLPWHESWFALLFGLLLWGSEIVSNFTGLLLIWNKNKAKPFEKPIVPEADYPAIDVLIATHNEEVPLLLKTVNAAVHMKYPDPKKVHIYLSDDTNRPEVKALADKFGIGYIGLTGNQHAKSGNLNHALSKTNSPLVATFDADMIPYQIFCWKQCHILWQISRNAVKTRPSNRWALSKHRKAFIMRIFFSTIFFQKRQSLTSRTSFPEKSMF